MLFKEIHSVIIKARGMYSYHWDLKSSLRGLCVTPSSSRFSLRYTDDFLCLTNSANIKRDLHGCLFNAINLLLSQRMPDMSNLHEVQTVDMLPPDTDSKSRQVKLSSCFII
jgi:hypothetical protein